MWLILLLSFNFPYNYVDKEDRVIESDWSKWDENIGFLERNEEKKLVLKAIDICITSSGFIEPSTEREVEFLYEIKKAHRQGNILPKRLYRLKTRLFFKCRFQ